MPTTMSPKTTAPMGQYAYDPDLSENKNRELALRHYLQGVTEPPIADPETGTLWYVNGVWVDRFGTVHAPSPSAAERSRDILFYWSHRTRIARDRLKAASEEVEGKILIARKFSDPKQAPTEDEADHVATLRAEYQRLRALTERAAEAAGHAPGRYFLNEEEQQKVIELDTVIDTIVKIANNR